MEKPFSYDGLTASLAIQQGPKKSTGYDCSPTKDSYLLQELNAEKEVFCVDNFALWTTQHQEEIEIVKIRDMNNPFSLPEVRGREKAHQEVRTRTLQDVEESKNMFPFPQLNYLKKLMRSLTRCSKNSLENDFREKPLQANPQILHGQVQPKTSFGIAVQKTLNVVTHSSF